MSADTTKALETVSEKIEEIWGGLVLGVEDDGQNDDAHKALLRGLLRIADQARGEVEIALGNAVRGQEWAAGAIGRRQDC